MRTWMKRMRTNTMNTTKPIRPYKVVSALTYEQCVMRLRN